MPTHNLPVSDDATQARFLQAFRARVRAARKACGLSQADVARLLGIGLSTYAKYETRSLLPVYRIEDFAAITGIGIAELFGELDPREG